MEPQNPSTGPRSEQGKAIASRNAIRHGLTSKHPWLLPNENPEAWRQLLDSYTACLRPANLIERDLTEQIAWARWQRDRLHSIFAALHALAILKDAGIDSATYSPQPDTNIHPEYLRQARALHANAGPEGAFGLLNRYLSRVNREYEKAYRLFEHVRANPIPQPSPEPDLPEPTIALPIELPPRPSAHDNPEWLSLVELTENTLKPFPDASPPSSKPSPPTSNVSAANASPPRIAHDLASRRKRKSDSPKAPSSSCGRKSHGSSGRAPIP